MGDSIGHRAYNALQPIEIQVSDGASQGEPKRLPPTVEPQCGYYRGHGNDDHEPPDAIERARVERLSSRQSSVVSRRRVFGPWSLVVGWNRFHTSLPKNPGA